MNNNKLVTGSHGRIPWIDVAKGLAMILVFYGHLGGSGDNPWFKSLEGSIWVVYLFHMPLFLMLSGLTFNPDKPFIPFVKSRFKRLIIPYYFFSLYVVGKILLMLMAPAVFSSFHGADMGTTSTELLKILLGKSNGLWFFWALFWSDLILYGLHKLLRSLCHIRIWMSVLAIVCAYAWFYLETMPIQWQIPFQLVRSLEGIAFVAFGWILSSWLKQLNHKESCMTLLFSAVAFIACAVILTHVGVSGIITGFIVKTLSILAAFTGSIMAISISQLLPVWSWLLYIGRNTMVFYGLNGLSLAIARKIVFFIISVSVVATHAWLQVCAGFVTIGLACIVCAIATPILNRWFWWGIGASKEVTLVRS